MKHINQPQLGNANSDGFPGRLNTRFKGVVGGRACSLANLLDNDKAMKIGLPQAAKPLVSVWTVQITEVAIGHRNLVKKEVARTIHADSLSHHVSFVAIAGDVRGFVAWDVEPAVAEFHALNRSCGQVQLLEEEVGLRSAAAPTSPVPASPEVAARSEADVQVE